MHDSMGTKTLCICNFQRFSVRDGPGIRTTIFLKGCNLRCEWCHNPEAINPEPEIQYFEEKCLHCGRCAEICPRFLTGGGFSGPSETCMHCGDCVQACPAGALASVGQIMTVEDASKTAARDKLFFKLSSGGVTVSGGEPLLQKNVVDLLRLLKEDAIHTAVDTALNMTWSRIMESMPYTDIYLADIKAVTPEVHDRYTGCNNGQILKNLRRLAESGKTIWIRTPLIPGANIGELPLIADFIRSLPLDHIWFELIPFHNYAYSKYKSLGMEYAFKDLQPPSGEEMNEYKKYFYGIKIVEYWK